MKIYSLTVAKGFEIYGWKALGKAKYYYYSSQQTEPAKEQKELFATECPHAPKQKATTQELKYQSMTQAPSCIK